MVEHRTLNPQAEGSSPSALTTQAADSSAAFVLPGRVAATTDLRAGREHRYQQPETFTLVLVTVDRVCDLLLGLGIDSQRFFIGSRRGQHVGASPRPRLRPPADRQCPAGTALSASQPCSSTQRSSAASSCRCAAGKISTVIATSPCCASAGNSLGADLGNGLLDRNSEASV